MRGVYKTKIMIYLYIKKLNEK